jgi:hypothetical protein
MRLADVLLATRSVVTEYESLNSDLDSPIRILDNGDDCSVWGVPVAMIARSRAGQHSPRLRTRCAEDG